MPKWMWDPMFCNQTAHDFLWSDPMEGITGWGVWQSWQKTCAKEGIRTSGLWCQNTVTRPWGVLVLTPLLSWSIWACTPSERHNETGEIKRINCLNNWEKIPKIILILNKSLHRFLWDEGRGAYVYGPDVVRKFVNDHPEVKLIVRGHQVCIRAAITPSSAHFHFFFWWSFHTTFRTRVCKDKMRAKKDKNKKSEFLVYVQRLGILRRRSSSVHFLLCRLRSYRGTCEKKREC